VRVTHHSQREAAQIEWPGWAIAFAASVVCLLAAFVYLAASINEVAAPSPAVADVETPELETSTAPERSVVPAEGAGAAIASEAPTRPTFAAVPVPQLVTPWRDAELERLIGDALGDNDEHVSVSVVRFGDGRAASVNGAREYYAASTFKLAVLYEAAVRHARGELDFAELVAIEEEDLGQDLGTFERLKFEADGTISVENLLVPMIEISDNVSAVTLMGKFGSWNIDATLRSLGIETMSVNSEDLVTTSDDVAALMAAIVGGAGVTDEERLFMRSLLLGQQIRGGIPLALDDELEEGLLVGNKTGTWTNAIHDVAFIEAPGGTFVLAVMTDGTVGWPAIHQVTRTVYDYLTERP